MAMSKELMVTELNNYLAKVNGLLNAVPKQKYITGTLPANQQAMYDAPAELGYTTDTHYIYSVGIDLRVVDPMVPTDPPVIQATAVVDYAIGADGKIFIRNNYNGPVTYFARISVPMLK